MRRCFYQVFRPEAPFYLDGWGRCPECQYSEENSDCKGFQPINLTLFNVEVEDEQGQ